MKKLILLLAIVISMQSCKVGEALTGKEHVRQQQSKGNYSVEKWKKEYSKLNSSKEKYIPTVTTQRP